MKENFEKKLLVLRYWLQGKEWFKALEALELGLSIHTGLRKDGVTKEFEHQVVQALYVKTLVDKLLYPEETMITVLLHDSPEDYDWVKYDMLEEKFGRFVADAIFRMAKKTNGIIKTPEKYFGDISLCPICSFAKPVDRFHNLLSMDGVFSLKKQKEYLEETEDLILPLAKKGRRLFPQQEPAYENIKLVINQQIALYRSMHAFWEKSLTTEKQ